MTKTIDLQVEKTRTLLKGLREHGDELRQKGVRVEATELDTLERDLQELVKDSETCDSLREQVSAQVKLVNSKLAAVKERFADLKKGVKQNFLPEEWGRYGVLDKR